jgi:hypothetical protein
VAERGSGQAGRPEATTQGSRWIAARIAAFRGAERRALAIALAGGVAGLLMIVTDLPPPLPEIAPVATVDVAAGACEVINDANPALADRCKLSGFERHGGALLLLGLLAFAMAYGAGIGGSRPAAAALIAIGTVVLVLALLSDLPETTRTGALGRNFEGASGQKGLGFWLELAAAAVAIGAGVAALRRPTA